MFPKIFDFFKNFRKLSRTKVPLGNDQIFIIQRSHHVEPTQNTLMYMRKLVSDSLNCQKYQNNSNLTPKVTIFLRPRLRPTHPGELYYSSRRISTSHIGIAIHIDLLRQQSEKLISRCPGWPEIDFPMIFGVYENFGFFQKF